MAASRESKTLYKKARKAEKSGDVSQAYIYYAQAAALDPDDSSDAWLRSVALRTQALSQADFLPEDIDALPDEAGIGQEYLGIISQEELAEARKPLPPLELDAKDEVLDFELRGDAKQLYDQVAPAYGLDAVYDGEFQPGKPVRLRIEQAGYAEALRILQAATGTFVTPISERAFMVAQDTVQKRQDLEHNMATVVPVPETVSVQEAQELARAVQQVMDIQKLVVDSGRRLVLLRDRVSRVRPAEAIFKMLLLHRPEVVIDVEFLEMRDNSNLTYGFKPPTEVLISFLGPTGTGSIPLGVPITAGMFGITVGNAEIAASMSRSNTRTLLRSQLRSVSGQPARLHVGDRYPIQSNAYIGDTSGGGEVYRPPPQITFEDLGVVLSVTPYVHADDEVTMEVEAEFKVLAGAALNGIPVVASRSFQAVTRMRTDEWAIMSGLTTESDFRSITGLAGIANIPYLGAFFRKTSKGSESAETLLVLKPSIVRMPIKPHHGISVWTGTESRPVSTL